MSDQCNHADLRLDPAGKVYLCKTCPTNFVATPIPSPLREPSETPEAWRDDPKVRAVRDIVETFRTINLPNREDLFQGALDALCNAVDASRRSALPVDTPEKVLTITRKQRKAGA